MRKPHGFCRLGLLLVLVICGCLPLLFAVGQTPKTSPPDEPGLRAKFGTAMAVDDKARPTVSDRPQQVDKESKKKKPGSDKEGGVLLYHMPVTPPNPDQLFRLDSEEVFQNRLRTEVRQRSPKVQLEFPEADQTLPARQTARDWPVYVKWVEPSYVVSKRLFFEQRRFERYGESLGILQPAVSSGIFVFDLFLWPARRMAQPFRCYQVNTDCYSPYFQIVRE